MYRNYITVQELLRFVDIQRYGDTGRIEDALKAAAFDVAADLKAKGFDLAAVYPPLMLNGESKLEPSTVNADAVGAAVEAQGQSRFVVRVIDELSEQAVFTLQGSVDNVVWYDVEDFAGELAEIKAQSKGISSSMFVASYTYYRYVVSTNSSVTFAPYLVDTGADELIRYKAVERLLLPHLSNETANDIYTAVQAKYGEALNSFHLIIDSDGDGGISATEARQSQTQTGYR